MEIKKPKVTTDVAVLTKEEIDKLREWIGNLESPCCQLFCDGIDCDVYNCPMKKLDDMFGNYYIALKRELDAIEEKQARAVYEK